MVVVLGLVVVVVVVMTGDEAELPEDGARYPVLFSLFGVPFITALVCQVKLLFLSMVLLELLSPADQSGKDNTSSSNWHELSNNLKPSF